MNGESGSSTVTQFFIHQGAIMSPAQPATTTIALRVAPELPCNKGDAIKLQAQAYI